MTENILGSQPMPKRFMVWGTKHKKFLTAPMEIWQITLHFRDRYHQLYDDNGNSRYIFCQSTNLFDKNGKEIFEGSIVRRAWEIAGDDENAPLFLVVWSPARAEFAFKYGIFHNGAEQVIDKKASKDVEVIGHILSDPELMETK